MVGQRRRNEAIVDESNKFGDDRQTVNRGSAKTPAEEAGVQMERKWSALDESPNGLAGTTGPLYFSSNGVEQKWESPQERAAYAAGLAEERTRRALRDARERLSATSFDRQPTASTNTTPPRSRSAVENQPSSIPSPAAPSPAAFLSTTPPTLPFFEKSNILLLGPSGSGKTLLLRTLAQALDVPFVHVDATPLTMAGYVGEDVESIIQRLLVEAGWDVERAQRGIVCIDEVDKLRKVGGGGAGGSAGKDVGGEGVQQALLRMLEGTVVEVANKGGGGKVVGGSQGKAGKMGVQKEVGDAVGGSGELGPWYNHRRRASPQLSAAATSSSSGSRFNIAPQPSSGPASFSVDTSSILFVLSGAFVGIEDIIQKRLYPTPSTNPSSTTCTATPTANQADLTQSTLLTHLTPLDLEHYGLIPEFVGRLPVSVVLSALTHDDLVRVMTEPRNSLVDQYTSLFRLNGIELHITHGAVDEVVRKAIQTGGGGARALRRIMEEVLLDAFYESYGATSVKYVLVERASVTGQGVRLFSRGQRFEFEARRSEREVEREERNKSGELDPNRTEKARTKAKRLIRARLRRTNRLVDPVIYI